MIAIIAVLAAMLLPALNRAKEMAQRSVCQSNLRQLYHGFTSYNGENSGWWLTGGYTDLPTWSRHVANELRLPFQTEQDIAGLTSFGGDLQSRNRVDANNGILQCPTENFTNNWGGRNTTSYRHNNGRYGYGYGFGISDQYENDAAYRQIHDNDLLAPANTILIGENNNDRTYEYAIKQFRRAEYHARYHNGGGNVLFADGHVQFITPQALTPDLFDRRK